MSRQSRKNIENYIAPLNMNGLQGRMLRMPPPAGKKREVLFIYGHHSNIERWWPLIQELNNFGSVTVPDLPGFGGMHSLYKIGEKPTIDALADYLAAFVKLRYKRRRLTIAGVSFGFVVVTRMLQRYPDIAKKVDVLISVAGFAHRDDFVFTRQRSLAYKTGATLFSMRMPAWFFRHICLNPVVLRKVYIKPLPEGQKLSKKEEREILHKFDAEVRLWHQNDVRTHMKTAKAMLTVDICQSQVDVPVWHVSLISDHYFDNNLVEQHLKVIFSNYHHVKARRDVYESLIHGKPRTEMPMVPYKLRRILTRA